MSAELLEHIRMVSYAIWAIAGTLRVLWLWQFRRATVVPGGIVRRSIALTSTLALLGLVAWGSIVKLKLTGNHDTWVMAYTILLFVMAITLIEASIHDWVVLTRHKRENGIK